MNDIRIIKKELREKYRLLREAIPGDVRLERDEAICRNISTLACFRFASVLLLYAPKDTEIDVTPLCTLAAERGIRIAFPKCLDKEGKMDFRFVNSPDDLIEGMYGIREPADDAEPVVDFSKSVLLVPGIVFDKRGQRIGYGRGYYDRFISSHESSTVGVVYSDFIVNSLPAGRFDRVVSVISTEKKNIFPPQKN